LRASAWHTQIGARSAAILRAEDPAKALAQNFSGYDVPNGAGAIDPVREVTSPERAKFNRHTAAWIALGAATPLIVYLSKDGAIYSQVGSTC
jgi:hypothetical protein